MKRSVQEIVELLVFGLIALLIGTALLWLVGWMFDLVGVLFKFFAGLIWSLLRFIVPVAIVAAVVYAVVRLFQQQRERGNEQRQDAATAAATPPARGPGEPPAPAQAESGEPHVSEVWAPPQPSPPADQPPADRPSVEQSQAGPAPAEQRFTGEIDEEFGEEPTPYQPTPEEPSLDEWTVESEPRVELEADLEDEPAPPVIPPAPADVEPEAEDEPGADAEEEDIDGERPS